MRNRWIAWGLLGTMMGLAPGVAAAQTTTQSTTTTSTTGAFDRLSPGNQQIARALFAAQTSATPTTSSAKQPATPGQSAPLTLDQIAAMKQSGKGWGEIFKSMKSQGLVQQKNLGQVVSGYRHQQQTSTTSPGARSAARSAPTQGGVGTGGTAGTASGRRPAQDSSSGGITTGGNGQDRGLAGGAAGASVGTGHAAGGPSAGAAGRGAAAGQGGGPGR